MELHHSKHHATYVAKLNEALGKHLELAEKSLEELLTSLDGIPEDIRTAVRNHGGGHYNHSFFWRVLGPTGKSGEPIPAILNLKEEFNKAAASLFGSGWVWLALPAPRSPALRGEVGSKAEGIIVTTTANQDCPITYNLKPVLGLDLWEHAYYLKYQNRRPEYIEAFWNIINWREVENNLIA